MRHAPTLLVVVLLGCFLFGGAFLLGKHLAPPCDGGYTGAQTYKSHQIECFHGDVVSVKP